MDEQELIRLLQRHRPQAPNGPQGEWQALARKTRPGSWFSWFQPRWALGVGVGLAAMAWVLLPLLPPTATALDDEPLEAYLSELHQEMNGSQALGAYDEAYVALLGAGEAE